MDSPRGYLNSVDLALRIAEKCFGKRISEKTIEKLLTLADAMYWIDDYIDSAAKGQKRAAVKELLAYLDGSGPVPRNAKTGFLPVVLKLKNYLQEAPSEHRREFLSISSYVIERSDLMASAKTIPDYMRERTNEANGVAEFMLVLARELNFDPHFATFFHQAMITGNMADSLMDAGKDKAEGKITLNPMRLRFAAAGKLMVHSFATIKPCPRKAQFLKASLIFTGQHLRLLPFSNRIASYTLKSGLERRMGLGQQAPRRSKAAMTDEPAYI